MTNLKPSTAVAPEEAWFKSSYSGNDGTNCVEVAALGPQIGVRDSKDKQGPALVFSADAFESFVREAASGRWNLPE